VVDLGCGTGIATEALLGAGYEVLGIEPSADMLAIARRRAPGARFVRSTAARADLPPCAAVCAIGEVLSYRRGGEGGRAAMPAVLERVARALAPGGLFMLDVAEPGREDRPLPHRAWREGEDWLICWEGDEDEAAGVMRRRIAAFRREEDGGWRRSDEVHEVDLVPREEVIAGLARAGLTARALRGYGGAYRFRRGHAGLVATKALS
jgi:SAM-dependent methyltransferase